CYIPWINIAHVALWKAINDIQWAAGGGNGIHPPNLDIHGTAGQAGLLAHAYTGDFAGNSLFCGANGLLLKSTSFQGTDRSGDVLTKRCPVSYHDYLINRFCFVGNELYIDILSSLNQFG